METQHLAEKKKAEEYQRGYEKARAEFDKNINKMHMDSKIMQSKMINEARLLKMNARNVLIEEVKKLAKDRLQEKFGPDHP